MNTTKKLTPAEIAVLKELSWFDKCWAIAPVEFSIILAGSFGSLFFVAIEIAYQFGLIF